MNLTISKGDFKSEDTGELLHCQNEYSKSLSWAENLNKMVTDLGGKFKFSALDTDLEFWQCKNPPVSSDLKPPLIEGFYFDSLTLLFWFDLSLWARIQKYFRSFFGSNETFKICSRNLLIHI